MYCIYCAVRNLFLFIIIFTKIYIRTILSILGIHLVLKMKKLMNSVAFFNHKPTYVLFTTVDSVEEEMTQKENTGRVTGRSDIRWKYRMEPIIIKEYQE